MLIRLLNLTFLASLLFLVNPYSAFSQLDSGEDSEENCFEASYRIDRLYPAFWSSRTDLKSIDKISDLNPHFQDTWVRKYLNVEISTVVDGALRKVNGNSNFLNKEQKELINSADYGANLLVKIDYQPDNSLKSNDDHEIKFEVVIQADKDASFLGGEDAMIDYLEKELSTKVPLSAFNQYALAAVTFTIDVKGKVRDTSVFASSNNEVFDSIMFETIVNMPKWTPAHYSNGENVAQDFVLRVGDMTSCVSNTLNLDRSLHPFPEFSR